MTKVKSLLEVMKYIATAQTEFLPEAEAALAICAVKVQADAKDKFGTYQSAVGPFEEWAQLRPATIKRKMEAGAESDDPLIGHYPEFDVETSTSGRQKFTAKDEKSHSKRAGGDLRNSILVKVEGLKAQIGSNDKLAPYHEYGTNRGIPPRPYLRPALYQNEEFIKNTLKATIAKVMMGK